MASAAEREILERIRAGRLRYKDGEVEFLHARGRWLVKRAQNNRGRACYLFKSSTGRVLKVYANRLIWMLFSQEEIPDGFNIDHVDGDKTNDRPENLQLHRAGDSLSQGNDRAEQSVQESLSRWFIFVGEYGREPLTEHERLYVETGF